MALVFLTKGNYDGDDDSLPGLVHSIGLLEDLSRNGNEDDDWRH